MKKILVLLSVFLLVSTAPAFSYQIDWADWNGSQGNVASGTFANGNIDITFTGVFDSVQTGTGTNYWTEGTPAPYTANAYIDNAPTPSEMIKLVNEGEAVISFSAPILNPVLAFVSIGRINTPLTYEFDTFYLGLSEGDGFWGDGIVDSSDGFKLIGRELHGAIMFPGMISEISMTYSPSENWHGITLGSSAPVPEPATMVLLGMGLLGLAGIGRRKVS